MRDEEIATQNFHNMEMAVYKPGKAQAAKAKTAVKSIVAEAKKAENTVERAAKPGSDVLKLLTNSADVNPKGLPQRPPRPKRRTLVEPQQRDLAGSLQAAYAGQQLMPLRSIGTATMFNRAGGANSTSDKVVNVPLQDAYEAAARYTQCLIDPWITPEGVHMPDDGECVAVGAIKNMPSFNLTFANGTVGCDGGIAWQLRGDTLKSYRIGSVAANGDVTWPNAWVDLCTSDVKTGERLNRPIVVGLRFILTEFGDPHMIRFSTYRTPPSSAGSSSTSPVLNVAVGLTQAQIDDGRGTERKLAVPDAEGKVPMSFSAVTFKCYDSYSRHYWCDPATDRATHSGELVTGWAYGGRTTDQLLVIPVTHFEVTDLAGNAPLQSAVYASVRPSGQAHDVVGAVTDAITAAKMETSTDTDMRRNAVIESHVQKILTNQRRTSIAEQVLDKVQDWVLKPALNYLTGGWFNYFTGGGKEIFVGVGSMHASPHSTPMSPASAVDEDEKKDDLTKSVLVRATKILGATKQ